MEALKRNKLNLELSTSYQKNASSKVFERVVSELTSERITELYSQINKKNSYKKIINDINNRNKFVKK